MARGARLAARIVDSHGAGLLDANQQTRPRGAAVTQAYSSFSGVRFFSLRHAAFLLETTFTIVAGFELRD